MSDYSAQIAANLAEVRGRIAQAAARSGRSGDEVTLVGATKYVDAALTQALLTAGCLDLGESRPQDLWAKAAAVVAPQPRWHLIGHLQRNKVARTLPLVSLIHSVDSERLLAAIEREAAALARPISILLEVNISRDASKHGFRPDEMPAIVARLGELTCVSVRGLMGMAALEGGIDVARGNFARLRALRDQLQPNAPDGIQLTELSMGMSGDFEVAIEEGATIVRVGSALFAGTGVD